MCNSYNMWLDRTEEKEGDNDMDLCWWRGF